MAEFEIIENNQGYYLPSIPEINTRYLFLSRTPPPNAYTYFIFLGFLKPDDSLYNNITYTTFKDDVEIKIVDENENEIDWLDVRLLYSGAPPIMPGIETPDNLTALPIIIELTKYPADEDDNTAFIYINYKGNTTNYFLSVHSAINHNTYDIIIDFPVDESMYTSTIQNKYALKITYFSLDIGSETTVEETFSLKCNQNLLDGYYTKTGTLYMSLKVKDITSTPTSIYTYKLQTSDGYIGVLQEATYKGLYNGYLVYLAKY